MVTGFGEMISMSDVTSLNGAATSRARHRLRAQIYNARKITIYLTSPNAKRNRQGGLRESQNRARKSKSTTWGVSRVTRVRRDKGELKCSISSQNTRATSDDGPN
ncbi:hypothetical protein EVAR_52970_1 [Eumeta japonica]|uniref:Uncharacterized protein n=1 Tax=Eumeta variegata TaxID=151549 RepID=A0A4C1YTZ7_EUMVA|nr:hypothetical protein EVAR_52970_1 [Eumeta japonica]